MAGIFAHVDSDIQKLQRLKQEIENVKKSLKSINVKVDIDIAKGLESQLKSLTTQYNALAAKVGETEARITTSANKIIDASNKIIQAQEKMSQVNKGTNVSSSGTSETPSANATETVSIQAQAKAYDELEAEIDAVLGTRMQNIKRLIEEKNAIRLLNAEIKKITKSQGESSSLSSAQQRRLEQLNNSLLTHKTALAEVRQNLNANAKLDNAAATSMDALSQSLGRMRAAYRALTDSERISPFGKDLLASIDQADVKIKALDATIGNHQRNVGNYASGWNGLSMSIQQIGRELPSLAVGWNTFFLAISNNLPILADEIKRARIQFEALKKSGQTATPVWKQVVSSIVSWQTALTVGITLLTLYGDKLVKWISSLGESKEEIDANTIALDAMNNAIKAGHIDAQKEINVLKVLYRSATDETLAKKERIIAVNELQRLYPDYLKNMSTENIMAGKANSIYIKLTKSIMETSIAKSKMAEVDKLSIKAWNLSMKAAGKLMEIRKAETENDYVDPYSGEIIKAADRVAHLKEEYEGITKELRNVYSAQIAITKGIKVSDIVDANTGKKDKIPASDKQLKQQEQLAEQLLSLRRQNQQAEIDLMKEGTEKKLKQIDLDYQKELDAIKKQKAYWEASQGGKLTDEQNNLLGIRSSNAAIKREKGITNTKNEQLENDRKAWQEYFIEFGNYQEKRKNLIQKYDDELAKLQVDSPEFALKAAEKNQVLEQLDEQYGKSTKSMADLFEDASEKSVSAIQDIIDKYELLIKYMSGTDKTVSFEDLKTVGFTDRDLKNLENGTISIKDVTDAIKRLKEEVAGKSPWLSFFSDMKKGIDDIKNASGDTKKLGQGISTIGNAITEFSPAVKQFGSDIASIFGEELSDEVNNVIDGISGLGQTAVGVGQIMSGDIAGGAMSAVSGISQLVNAMGNLFGPNGTAYYESVKEQLEAINEVYDRIIEKGKEDIVFGGGFASIQSATQALDNYEKKLVNLQKIADASGRAGASWNSHSAEWHSNKNVGADNFAQMSDILGKSIQSMGDLYYLSGNELYLIQSQMPEAWSKIDDRIKENLQSIIDCKDEAEELKDSLNEAMTGVDFDSFYNGFIDQLSDMDTSFEDMCDNFEEYLRKSIIAGIVASQYQDRIKALYTQWSDAAKSGNQITADESDALRNQYQQIIEDMMYDREEMAKTFGWDTSSSSQESSSKGFATASQDSIDELNGRFTALQIAGEEIKNQNQLQTMSILELKAEMIPIIANTSGIKDIASETRDLLRISYEELTGIHDDTTSMNKSLKNIESDIAEVKRNTNGLSSR